MIGGIQIWWCWMFKLKAPEPFSGAHRPFDCGMAWVLIQLMVVVMILGYCLSLK